MFYQLLRVQHSCSSTQSWGSVLPSIVETRDENSRGCPLLFSNRNLGSFCVYGTEVLCTHSFWEVVDHSRSKMHETCLIIIHDPGMRPGSESGTFGLADECSTTKLTLLLTSLRWYPGVYSTNYNYIKLVTNSASWLHIFRWFLVGRDNTEV